VAKKNYARQLTPQFVKKSLSASAWDFGNRVLYDLCSANPGHVQADIIIAKVWLIGRSYAAAIERRKGTDGVAGDPFYETVVAPKIRCSGIDGWLQALAISPNNDTVSNLETHLRVTRLFAEISGRQQRSLASKYLHFHFPKRFYIYDNRAQKAISKLVKPIGRKLPPLREYDDAYARFFLRCLDLSLRISSIANRPVSPRDLDKVLLAYG
jgi:hypothetical protein